jgi:hypothetical protein
MDIDFKNMTLEEESAIRLILSKCRYLRESAKWNVEDSVLVGVARDLSFDYASLVNATKATKSE